MSDEFKLGDSTSHLLHRAQQLAADRFAASVGENGVTLRQFEVLAAIYEKSGLSQSELVDATGIDRSTLADMMNRMEKRGWIIREASASDARANAVRLAPAGAILYHATVRYALAADAAVLDELSKPKGKAFHATLQKLARAADAASAAARRAAARAVRAERKKSRDDEKGRRKSKAEAVAKPPKKTKKNKAAANREETASPPTRD